MAPEVEGGLMPVPEDEEEDNSSNDHGGTTQAEA